MFDVRTLSDDAIVAIANDPDVIRRILANAHLLTMEGVGEQVGISYYRVKILRGKRVQIGDETMPRSDALPPSLPLPGDPLWHPREIETWGRQTGRLDQDGNPQRAQPTGRPRQSDEEQRVARAALAEAKARIREEKRAARAALAEERAARAEKERMVKAERAQKREEQQAAKAALAKEQARIREEQQAAKAALAEAKARIREEQLAAKAALAEEQRAIKAARVQKREERQAVRAALVEERIARRKERTKALIEQRAALVEGCVKNS